MLRMLRWVVRLFRRPKAAPPASEAIAAAPVRRARSRLAAGVAAVAAGVFGAFGWLVGQSWSAPADLFVSAGMQEAEHTLLLDGMRLVSSFGTWPFNLVTVAATMLGFGVAGLPREAAFVGLAASGAVALSEGLKRIWLRPRPSTELVRVVGSPIGTSFPSGHTVFFVGFFGFLFYWAYANLRRGRARTLMLWLTGLLIVLIGPSRVYLGQHWASDVLAGYAIGLVYLLGVIWIYRRLGAPRPQAATSPPRLELVRRRA